MGLTDRRTFLAGAALCLTAAPAAFAASSEVIPLKVSADRSTTLTLWIPDAVRGVVLFSTGHGSWPDQYDGIAKTWRDAGFAVIAPLHVDSLHYPERERFSLQQSFPERLADLRAASAYAAERWAGLPVAVAGHSFGTLISLCLGGSLAGVGPFRDPSVKAVMGFSSPGKIPGLITPDAYSSLAMPAMIVTGDRDVVPGYAADWRDHLFPIETAPAGDKYGVVLAGAPHDMIGGEPPALFADAARISTAFLRAYVLEDVAARTSLDGPNGPSETWTRR